MKITVRSQGPKNGAPPFSESARTFHTWQATGLVTLLFLFFFSLDNVEKYKQAA